MKFKNNIALMLLLTTPFLTVIANTEPSTVTEETAVEEVDEILTNEEIIQLAQLAEEREAAEEKKLEKFWQYLIISFFGSY